MKRIFHHPPAPAGGRKYWRSLNELADSPEFKQWLEREFPAGAHEIEMDGISRRHFLRLMGASMALAGLGMTSCRRPEAYFVPYTKSPEWLIPGEAIQYATAMPRRRGYLPVLATCVDGRPIKIEPNKDFPNGGGGTDAFAQAAILDLYDPYRSKAYKKRPANQKKEDPPSPAGDGEWQEWGDWVEPGEFYAELGRIRERYSGNGQRLAFLTEASTSPTRERVRKALAKEFPGLTWATYEPVSNENALAATEAVLGGRYDLLPDFGEADVILSLEADFLDGEEGGPAAIKGFADGRRRVDQPGAKMNRLYVIESRFTTTGGAADHRLRVASSLVAVATQMLASAIAKLDASAAGVLRGFPMSADFAGISDQWITAVAKDLLANKGKSIVVAGPLQSPAVHQMVLAINQALGNLGRTIEVIKAQQPAAVSIAKLADKIRAKGIDTLFILGGNPAYNAPADLDWAGLQASVPQVIRAGAYEDETTVRSDWHVPLAHWLEGWSDGRTRDGSYTISQPMVLPLFGGVSELDLLGIFAGMVQPPSTRPEQKEAMEPPQPAPGAATMAAAAGGQNAAAEAAAGQPEPVALVAAAEKQRAAAEDVTPPTPQDRLPQDEALPEVCSHFLVQQTFLQLPEAQKALGQIGDAPNAAENLWRQTLHDGYLAGSRAKPLVPALQAAGAHALAEQYPATLVPEDEYELTFYPSPSVDDGRYANNGWLQEMPQPMLTLTWDNALLVSPRTAEAWVKQGIISHSTLGDGGAFLGLESVGSGPGTETRNYQNGVLGPVPNAPMVKLIVGGRELEVAVLTTPGQADQSLALALGYGHEWIGPVAKGAGFNAYRLRTSQHPGVVTGVKVEPLPGRRYLLALTQEHNAMQGRGIVREAPLSVNQQHPEWVKTIGVAPHTPGFEAGFPPIYPNPYKSKEVLEEYPQQWGMAIDLNTCTGCNACVIACQAENNIPIVGKQQVSYGREMHWLRMDRYYSGDREDPQLLVQPMLCMHCEQAPCETVCPVNATVHSEDGLNVMAYNRCIGTRYCANNCPYKVRRFNYFDYNKRPISELYWGPLAKQGMADTLQMSKNPNVTVRMRGVMEKCTYCVQRIEEARIAQLRKAKGSPDRNIPPNGIHTACQDACTAGSIVFGDILDKKWEVAKLKANPRNYGVLDYLGVGPRTTYLGRVRNPNPEVPGAELVGVSSEMHFDHGGHGADAANGHGHGHGHEGGDHHPQHPAPHAPADKGPDHH